MKRLIFPLVILGLVLLCKFAAANMQRSIKVVTASTNASLTYSSNTLPVRGEVRRMVITTGSGKTCDVSFVDKDGTTLLTVTNVSGVTNLTGLTLDSTSLDIWTANANATNVTVTNSATYEF